MKTRRAHHSDRAGTSRSRLASVLATVFALLLLAPSPGAAQEMGMDDEDPDWLVRPLVAVAVMNGEVEALDLETGSLVTFGADVTRFVSPNWGLNLLLAVASTELEAADGTSFGSLEILPPTLTLQHHFAPDGPVRPYLGAGGNLSIFYNESGTLDEVNTSVDPGVGLALQGGADFMVSDGVSVFTDVRWVAFLNDPSVETDAGDAELDHDMAVISAGLGFRM